MKTKITLIAITAIIVAACGTSKKNTTSTASSSPTPPPATASPTTTTSTPSSNFYMVTKSPDGIYAPGNEELTAIQEQYKEVTLNQLTEGQAIYTQGACIRCHGAQNIYVHNEVQWKDIMDDMAQKAVLNDAQKEAVYKYVLAIKAAQPKPGK